MNIAIKQQLSAFLQDAIEAESKVVVGDAIENVYRYISRINDTCIKILDHTYNHFSKKPNDGHFPRPKSKSEDDYTKHIETTLVKYGDNFNVPLRSLLSKVVGLVGKYDWDIRFLDGGMKHKLTNKFEVVTDMKNILTHETIGVQPIVVNDGCIVPGLGFFPSGKTLRMSGCVVQANDSTTYINKLDYSPIYVSGNYIILSEGGNIERRELATWLTNCISTCKSVIALVDSKND